LGNLYGWGVDSSPWETLVKLNFLPREEIQAKGRIMIKANSCNLFGEFICNQVLQLIIKRRDALSSRVGRFD
jgi:hypothetical protein